jgi:hypothetical protein
MRVRSEVFCYVYRMGCVYSYMMASVPGFHVVRDLLVRDGLGHHRNEKITCSLSVTSDEEV